jgi:hypothetical protein
MITTVPHAFGVVRQTLRRRALSADPAPSLRLPVLLTRHRIGRRVRRVEPLRHNALEAMPGDRLEQLLAVVVLRDDANALRFGYEFP